MPLRLSLYLKKVKGRLCFIDVGANIGFVTYLLSGLIDKGLAIEPYKKFYNFLKLNLSDIDKKIKLINEACAALNEEQNLLLNEGLGTASLSTIAASRSDKAFMSVTIRTLDSIVEENNFTKVDFIKIDTDGFDFEVIKGAKKIISSCKPAVLFECDDFSNKHFAKNCLEVLNFFKENNYNYFLVYDNFGILMGLYSLENLENFYKLLFYKLNSKTFYYFDILIMQDNLILEFYKEDIYIFINNQDNESKRINLEFLKNFINFN